MFSCSQSVCDPACEAEDNVGARKKDPGSTVRNPTQLIYHGSYFYASLSKFPPIARHPVIRCLQIMIFQWYCALQDIISSPPQKKNKLPPT